MRASMLGVPVVALSVPPTIPSDEAISATAPSSSSKEIATAGGSSHDRPMPSQGGIYLSIPLRFRASSPLVIDDGTPRIVQITSSICVAHTGVGADGRALCDIATKIALDYRYIYGEEIMAEELLEGLADKVQEMTMRAGSRPYGCALLVGCLGGDDDYGNDGPAMYRLDPSGAVVLLNSSDDGDSGESLSEEGGDNPHRIPSNAVRRRGTAAFLGNWDPLRQKKDNIQSQLESQQFTSEEDLQSELIDAARQTYTGDLSMGKDGDAQSKEKTFNQPILFASFTREHGLQIARITNPKEN